MKITNIIPPQMYSIDYVKYRQCYLCKRDYSPNFMYTVKYEGRTYKKHPLTLEMCVCIECQDSDTPAMIEKIEVLESIKEL